MEFDWLLRALLLAFHVEHFANVCGNDLVNLERKCDYLFIIDKSFAISQNDLKIQKEFINKLLKTEYSQGSQYGIISYSDDAYIEVPFTFYPSLEIIQQKINSIEQSGSTNFPDKGLYLTHRTLLENYVTTRDDSRDYVVYFINTNIQPDTDNNIPIQSMIKNLRQYNFNFHFISISSRDSNKHTKSQISKVANVIKLTNFEELLQPDVIVKFEGSCSNADSHTNKRKYFLNLLLIGMNSRTCSVAITKPDGLSKESHQLLPQTQKKLYFQAFAFEEPSLEISGNCTNKEIYSELEENENTAVVDFTSYKESLSVVAVHENRIRIVPVYQINLLITNLLEKDVILNWKVNKKTFDLKVDALSSKNNFVMNIYDEKEAPREIIFFVGYKQNSDVLLNRHHRIILEMIEPFKQLFLFISNRDTPVVGNFSFSYVAFNMASEDIFLQLSSHDGHELKTSVQNEFVTSIQQPVSMLAITEDDFAIVRSFLPLPKGSNTLLFIGNFFERKVPFGFHVHLHNLEDVTASVTMKVLNHKYTKTLKPLTSSNVYLQFSFLEKIPAIEVISIYLLDGVAMEMYVNNRPVDFLLSETQDDVLTVVCAKEKAFKSFIYAHIRNDVQQSVDLLWSLNSSTNYLFHPRPPQKITLKKNTEEERIFTFYTHRSLKSVQFHVQTEKEDEEEITINDKQSYSADTNIRLPIQPESFLIRTEGEFFYVRINAINNLLNDVLLKWEFDSDNAQVISKSASKFIIGGKNRQLISVKFKKLRQANGNERGNIERIQFSALDVESHKKLFVNSLHFFSVNATDTQHDPVDLVIKNPSYQYFFVFEAINQLSKNVYLNWNVQNDTGSIMDSEYPQHQEFFLRPLSKELYSVQFTSRESLTENQLKKILEFQASDSNKDRVLVNETTRFFVDLSKPKERAVVLILSTTESYRRVADFSVVKITSNSIMLRWKKPENRYDFVFQWWEDNSSAKKSKILINKNLKTDGIYYYHTIRNLVSGRYYSFNVKKNIAMTQDAIINVHLENYQSPSTISVSGKNMLEEDVNLLWWTNTDVKVTKLVLQSLKELETYFVFEKERLPDKVFIQLVEGKSKLLLLFEDGRDILEIYPKDYEKEIYFTIKKDQNVVVKQNYFAHLSFTNLALSYAKITVRNIKGKTIHQQFVAPGSSNDNNINLKQLVSKFPSPYTVSAESTRGERLPLNRRFNLTIFPLVENIEIPIYIADLEFAEDLPQNYFLDVSIINQWKNAINIIFFSNGKINRHKIPSSQSYRFIELENADESPPFILGKVIDDRTDNHLMHNEKPEIILQYSSEYQPIRIVISENGVVTVERAYFVDIKIINKRNEKSYLQFNRKIETLEANSKVHHRFLIYDQNDPQPLLLSAFNLEENALNVNGEKFVAILPASLSTREVIVIRDVPVEDFKVKLRFINLVSDTIDVFLQVNSKIRKLVVAGKSLFVDEQKVAKGSQIILKALYSGSVYTVRLNRSKEHKLTVDNEINEMFYIGASGNQLDRSLIPYFYHFAIQNLNPENIIVRWSEIEKEKTLVVRSGEKETYWQVMLGLKKPPNIRLHFYGSRYQDLLYVNGEANTEIQPSKYGHLTSIILDVGSTVRIYFAKIYYINTLPYEVTIKNNENNEKIKLLSFSSQEQQLQRTESQQPNPIVINAYANNQKLFINGENEGMQINLSRDPKKRYLFIGIKESSSIDQLLLKIIKIDIVIRNRRLLPIKVQIFYKYELLFETVVPANTSKAFKRTVTDQEEDPFIVARYLDAIEGKYLSSSGNIDYVLKCRHLGSVEYEIKKDLHVDNSWKVEPSVYLIYTNVRNEFRKPVILNFNNQLGSIKALQISSYSYTHHVLVFPLNHTFNMNIYATIKESGDKILLNGRGFYNVSSSRYCCLNDPLIDDVQFVVNLHVGKKGPIFVEKTFTAHNHHSSSVKLNWNFNHYKGSVPIISGQSVVFFLSHGVSPFSPEIHFSAIDGKENVVINNKSAVVSWFDDNSTILDIGDASRKDDIIVVEFINRETEPVYLQRTMLNGVSVQLSRVELASEEKKRVYLSFPRGVYLYTMKAYLESSNKLLSINNQFKWDFSKYAPTLSQVYIQQHRTTDIPLRYEIDCNNRYRENVTISWNENGFLKNYKVKSGERVLIRGEFYADRMQKNLTFRAESDSKIPMAINGLDQFEIIVTDKDQIYFVIISEKKVHKAFVRSSKRGLTIRAVNHLNDDVNIFWHWPDIGGYVATVSANSERLLSNICDDLEMVESVSFTGVSLRGEKVKLNGKFILTMRTNEQNLIMLHVEEATEDMVGEHFNVNLYNTYPLPVNIEWHSNDGVKRFLTMLPGEKTFVWDQVRRKKYGEKTIAFQAWDMANKNNVLLNDRKLLNVLLPERNIGRDNYTDIVITKDNTTTFYTMFITNKFSQNIRFTWTAYVATEEKGVIAVTGEIPIPKTEKYFKWFQYFVRKPLYVVFRSYNVNNGKQLYLNGKKSFNLTSQRGTIKYGIPQANQMTASSLLDKESTKSEKIEFKNELSVGDVVRLQKYTVNLIVTNLLRKSVGMKWNINGDQKWKLLRPFQFNYVIKVEIMAEELPPEISFHSLVLPAQRRVLTNDQKNFLVQPLANGGQHKYHYVFISEQKTLQRRIFFFKNPTNENIQIKWQTLARQGKFIVPKRQSNYSVALNVSGGYRIQSIRMTASSKTHDEIMLNSNRKLFARIPHRRVIKLDYFYRVFTFNNTFTEPIFLSCNLIKYSTEIPPLETVRIKILGKDIENGAITFTAIKKSSQLRVPISGHTLTEINPNKITPNVFQIGGNTESKSYYSLKLFLVNNHPRPVELMWGGLKNTSKFTVPVDFNEEISLIFEDSKLISFWSVDAVTKQPVYMNKRDALKFTPLKNVKYAETIVFDGEISLYDYFYQLSIDNLNENEVTVSMENNNDTLIVDVPADYRNFTISTPLFDFKSGIRKPMRIYVQEKNSLKPFKVNGLDYFTIFPTLDPSDVYKIVTGVEELPASSYQYSLSITVTEGSPDAILKYKFQREDKVSRIPKWAKNYRLVLPFKSYRVPTNITFRAYSEQSDKPLYINGHLEGVMIPYYDTAKYQSIFISESTYQSVSGPAFDYDFPLFVANPNSDFVNLLMRNKYKEDTLRIPPKAKRYLIPMFLTDETLESPFTFAAYLNDSRLKINGKRSLKLIDYKTDLLDIEKLAVTKVIISNTLPVTVFVRKTSQTTETVDQIDALKSKTFEFYKLQNQRVKLTAFALGGRNLSLNNSSFFMVRESAEDSITVFIRVLTLYYSLFFRNTELYEVEVKWSHASTAHRHVVKGQETWSLFFENNEIDMSSFETYFTAERVWRKKPMYLNNQGVFSLTPYSDENKLTTVLISDEPISLQRFLYIDLDVTNLLDTDILLKWNTNESKLIPRKVYQLNLVIAVPQLLYESRLVTFRAFPNDFSEVPVALNNQRSLHFMPLKNKYKKSIILSSLTSMHTTYNLHLTVQNHHYHTAIIRYKQMGTKLMYAMHVPARYHRTFNLVFIRHKMKPVSVLFWAYDAVRLNKIKINNAGGVQYQPRQKEESMLIHVGSTVPLMSKGEVIQQKGTVQNFPYYLGLQIINHIKYDVSVYWRPTSTVGEANAVTVPASGSRDLSKLILANWRAPWVAVRAVDERGGRLNVNGKNIFYVQASLAKSIQFVHIDSPAQVESYNDAKFVSLIVKNTAPFQVLLQWVEGDSPQNVLVKKYTTKEYNSVVKSPQSINSILIQAFDYQALVQGYDYSSRKPVFLNGRSELRLFPSSRLSVTNILVTDIESPRKLYHFGFVVYNLLRDSIVLHYRLKDNIRKVVRVPPHGVKSIESVVKQRMNFTLHGYNARTTRSVLMNGEKTVNISSSHLRGKYVILVGKPALQKSTLKSYSLNLQIVNRNEKDFVLSWLHETSFKKLVIPAFNVTNYIAKFRSYDTPPAVQFSINEKISSQAALLNGQSEISLQPRLNGYFAHLEITYDDFFRPGEILSGEPGSSNLCKDKVDVLFLLDSSGSMKRIFLFAKQFISMMSETFYFSPEHAQVGLIDFSEEAVVQIPLNRYTDHFSFSADVSSLPFIGFRTRLDLALTQAKNVFHTDKYGARRDASKLLFLLTDGRTTKEKLLYRSLTNSLFAWSRNVNVVNIALSGVHPPDHVLLSYVTKSNTIYQIDNEADMLTAPFLNGLIYRYCRTWT